MGDLNESMERHKLSNKIQELIGESFVLLKKVEAASRERGQSNLELPEVVKRK